MVPRLSELCAYVVVDSRMRSGPTRMVPPLHRFEQWPTIDDLDLYLKGLSTSVDCCVADGPDYWLDMARYRWVRHHLVRTHYKPVEGEDEEEVLYERWYDNGQPLPPMAERNPLLKRLSEGVLRSLFKDMHECIFQRVDLLHDRMVCHALNQEPPEDALSTMGQLQDPELRTAFQRLVKQRLMILQAGYASNRQREIVSDMLMQSLPVFRTQRPAVWHYLTHGSLEFYQS